MKDKYAALSFSSPLEERRYNRIRRESNRRAAAVRSYADEDDAWEKQCLTRITEVDNDTTLPEELVIFWAASPLAMAKLTEELCEYQAILQYDYNQSTALTHLRDEIKSCLGHLYVNNWYGLSLTDILMNGKQVAQEMPVETYGFMLRSMRHANDNNEVREGVHAFTPIVHYPTEYLRTLARKERFPQETRETLLAVSSLFQESLTKVKKAFFDPDSEYFFKALQLYEDIIPNDEQRELFELQIIGINGDDQGRRAYAKARENVDGDKERDLYEAVITHVEDHFSGHYGEEAYELLGIRNRPDAVADYRALELAQAKKSKFLKHVKGSSGEIELSDGRYGNIILLYPKILFTKDGLYTRVTIKGFIETNYDEHIPICFTLNGDGTYEWNFLRTESEVPELFNTIVQAVDCALEQAGPWSSQPMPSNGKGDVSKSKEHFRDPVYDLRRLVAEDVDSSVNEVSFAPADSPEIKLWSVSFSESVLETTPQPMIDQAKRATEKYEQGLIGLVKMRPKTVSGRKSFRLRHGDIRVIVELDEDDGVLIVTEIGLRRDIYR